MKPNVNVTVGGPVKPTNYTYKTVILKNNLPFAAQIGDPNCIYVIKWDYDLGGETVTIPENCVLKFEGGSISNGTVVGNNTSIISNPIHIFDNVVFEGTLAEDLVLNNFVHSNDCTTSSYATSRSIYVTGTCVIDEPLLVKTYFSIYGDSMEGTKIELSPSYTGDIKTIFMFDSTPGGIGWTNFRNFKVTDIDYVFYRDCGSKHSSVGAIYLTTYENLHFETINKSLFYIKCYGFSTSKINNIFVGGPCNREGEALMWFDVYYYNYNVISGSNFSGLAVKKLMYVYASNNNNEGGELNINSILNSRFEDITIANDSCLIHYHSMNVLYNSIIEGNYIERIRKGSSSGPLGTIFKYTNPYPKITRQVNLYNNLFNGEFETLIVFEANVVGMNIIGNSPITQQKITCTETQILDVVLLSNTCTFNIIADNVITYNTRESAKTKDFNGRFYNVVHSKIINAGEHEDLTLIPSGYNRPIYYSDVQITWSNGESPRNLFTGKILGMDGENFIFHKTYGESELVTVQPYDLNGVVRVSNLSDGPITVRVGAFIANYEA